MPAYFVRILWLAVGWTVLQILIALAGGFGGLFGDDRDLGACRRLRRRLVLARPSASWRFKRGVANFVNAKEALLLGRH